MVGGPLKPAFGLHGGWPTQARFLACVGGPTQARFWLVWGCSTSHLTRLFARAPLLRSRSRKFCGLRPLRCVLFTAITSSLPAACHVGSRSRWPETANRPGSGYRRRRL